MMTFLFIFFNDFLFVGIVVFLWFWVFLMIVFMILGFSVILGFILAAILDFGVFFNRWSWDFFFLPEIPYFFPVFWMFRGFFLWIWMKTFSFSGIRVEFSGWFAGVFLERFHYSMFFFFLISQGFFRFWFLVMIFFDDSDGVFFFFPFFLMIMGFILWMTGFFGDDSAFVMILGLLGWFIWLMILRCFKIITYFWMDCGFFCYRSWFSLGWLFFF